MFNILMLNKISKCGLGRFSKENFTLFDKCTSPDGIILRSFNMHEANLPDTLCAIARAGAGVNNIPIDKCTEKGIVVFNTPGANANAVKELVITALLIGSRKISEGIAWAQSLKGADNIADIVEKGKAEFSGPEILGKKLGVIGLGAVGLLVANAAEALGMDVLGYDPHISAESAWKISSTVKHSFSIDEIYENCDYITIHVPLLGETRNMFCDSTFAKVKKGLRLINFSRGEIVDNQAVIKALREGIVASYVTDFPVSELLGIPNVIPVPHLGASTPESEDNCAEMAAKELKEYLEYGNIKNSVNFPDCCLSYTGKKRFCVLHKNVPNVIGPITSILSKHGINIENMLSKSNAKLAYAIIDVDNGKANAAVAAELLEVDGVIRIRLI